MSTDHPLLRSAVLAALIAAISLLAFSSGAGAGQTQTYVVLYRGGASSADAGSTIQKAGGTVVQNYSQIGVVIARSSSPSFRDGLMRDGRIEGVSSTDRFGAGLENDAAATDDSGGPGDLPNAPATDNDALSQYQWDMELIHAPEAHEITGGSPDVIVGDIDTGLDYTHPDLVDNVDFDNSVSCESGTPDQDPSAWNDRSGHGTHTAGTIAAASNDIGIVGVAPNVKIAAIKAGNDDGYFFPEAVICAFMWAGTHDIDITNNSYFADPWLYNCRNDSEQRAIWKAEQRAIRFAQSRGVLVVSAQGNENHDLAHPTTDELSPDWPPDTAVTREVNNACIVIPVEIPGVVGVTAVGPDAEKSFYSSYGLGIADVTAPGGDSTQRPNPVGRVLSTLAHDTHVEGVNGIKYLLDRDRLFMDPPGCVDAATGVPAADCAMWAYFQGTSMASPHAAGVAALIQSQFGPLPPGAIAAMLQQTGVDIPCPQPRTVTEPFELGDATCLGGRANNGFYGHGLVDAEAAVQ